VRDQPMPEPHDLPPMADVLVLLEASRKAGDEKKEK